LPDDKVTSTRRENYTMGIDFMSHPDDNAPAEVEMMGFALLGVGHGMSDYLLSNDSAMREFAQFAYDNDDSREGTVTTENVAELREGIAGAHAMFAALEGRARDALFLAQIIELAGEDAGL
jgi:hypothetical protein